MAFLKKMCQFFSITVVLTSSLLSNTVDSRYQPTSPYILNPELAIDYIRNITDFRSKARDNANGGYYTNINRQGYSTGANEKALCGQSRIAYAFTRAFMVTGDEEYLEKAHHALKFLYDHGWNNGWYFITDLAGNYLSHWGHNDWWSFQQHYALIGISAMVEATGGNMNWNDGSESDHTWLMRGVNSNYTKLWDSNPATKGYFNYSNRAWTNKWGKGFTPTVDGVTTHALLMALMYDSLNHKQRLIDLANNTVDHLVGSMSVAGAGFPENYDANWNIDYNSTSMDIGHGYKTAWVLQRAYLRNPDHPEYLAGAQYIMKNLWDHGCYDSINGAPFSYLNWQTGAVTSTNKDFWMTEQGFTSGIISYYTATTQEQRDLYLRIADGSINFFMNHIIDPVYGEAYNVVNRDGSTVVDENKGGLFTAGYHSTELGYYAYLYGSLYYHKNPVQLYYYYPQDNTERTFKLTPIAIEENVLKIIGVTLDGVTYTDFNSNTRTIHLPAGVGGKFKVTFGVTPVPTHTIHAQAGTGGSISPAGEITVVENGSQTFTINPVAGYVIRDVMVDGVSAGAIATYTFLNVMADHNISVVLSAIPAFTITATSSSGGTISPSGTITVSEGSSPTISFIPSTGYSISSVVVDGVAIGTAASYTFSNITANHTISVAFAIKTYTITASSGAGGSISPSGAVAVQYGLSQTFTITPSTGYQVSNVLVDGVSVGAVNLYTFSSVAATHIISVSFAVISATVYQINCGGSISSPFTADQYFSGGTVRTVTNTITTTGVTNPAPQTVYQAERYGTVTYTLPNLTVGSQYNVRLHFAELYWTATGKRKFNVVINGTTALSNYDIYASTGARYKAVVKEFSATANASGQIIIKLTNVTDNATIGGIEIIQTTSNAAPTIATVASATPNPVTASTTTLSVLGADDNSEANLTYNWATSGTVPAPVTFSANGTNAAKVITATFTKAGTYTFQATVKDQGNLTATSSVVVTVNQTITTITLTPLSVTVQTSATQQFTGIAFDQFGTQITTSVLNWMVSSGGTISAAGLFTAETVAGGPYTVSATSGTVSGMAQVTIAQTQNSVVVYDDQLATGYANYSWGVTCNLNDASPVKVGSKSLSITYTSGWAGLQIQKTSGTQTHSGFTTYSFWAHGGTSGTRQCQFFTRTNSGQESRHVNVDIPSNTWTQIIIPLSSLGNPTDAKTVLLQERSGKAQPEFNIDLLELK